MLSTINYRVIRRLQDLPLELGPTALVDIVENSSPNINRLRGAGCLQSQTQSYLDMSTRPLQAGFRSPSATVGVHRFLCRRTQTPCAAEIASGL